LVDKTISWEIIVIAARLLIHPIGIKLDKKNPQAWALWIFQSQPGGIN
jgi:hypothetical protein